MPIFKKIPLVVFVFLLVFGLIFLFAKPFVSSASAQNATGRDCVLTINGQTTGTTSSSLPTINATRTEREGNGYRLYFDSIEVQPGPGQDAFPTSGSIKMAYNRWGIGSWEEATLTLDGAGSLVGSFSTFICTSTTSPIGCNGIGLDSGPPIAPMSFTFDIETSTTEICKARYGAVVGQSVGAVQDIADAELAMCNSLSVTPTTGIVANMALGVSYGLDYPQILADTAVNGLSNYSIKVTARSQSGRRVLRHEQLSSVGQQNFVISSADLSQATYDIEILKGSSQQLCIKTFCAGPSATPGQVGLACADDLVDPNALTPQPFQLCGQIPDKPEFTEKRLDCCECASGTRSIDPDGSCELPPDTYTPGLWSAVGCIKTSQEGIVTHFIRTGLGIAGGVALLMILAASFMLTTSQGEPKRAGEARELLTSAVIGLLFIIFSVTILQFIGVTILKIPGFGR